MIKREQHSHTTRTQEVITMEWESNPDATARLGMTLQPLEG